MSNDMVTGHYSLKPVVTQNDQIELLALLGTLWRGKTFIAACALCALVVAMWYAFVVAVPMYRSSAQLSLLVKTENVIDIDAVLAGVTPDQSSINTEMEVIQSRGLLADLVDGLDLIRDPEFNSALRKPALRTVVKDKVRERLGLLPHENTLPESVVRNNVINELRGALSVVAQDKSFIFTISATTEDPAKSALIANTLAQYYENDQIAVRVASAEKAATWLADRVADLQVEIQEAEGRINTLRSRNTLISTEAVDALNAQSVEVTANQRAAEIALRRATARLDAAKAAVDADYTTRAAIADDAELIELVPNATSGVRAQERFDRRFNQVLLQLSGDVARAQEALTDLNQVAETITARFEQQSEALVEIKQTERDTEATRVLYETFLTRLKETTAQIGTFQAESRLLSEAIPGDQVAPRTSTIVTMAVVLGLTLGAAAVLIREAMQNTFRTASDLEARTGRTVLGQVPRIPARTRVSTIAYLQNKPASAVAEAIRNLRTSILMSNIDTPSQVIVSTSSIPGEGKTTLAIALALNLAGQKKKVMLIEGDIRRRTFTEYFPEAHANAGLLSVISGAVPLSQAVWRHPTANFDILMGEWRNVNAADVLSSRGFAELIKFLRGKYDYIIIDTPPVLVVPDARIISTLADAILYMVKWDSTTRSQVDEGLKQFRHMNVPVTGLVLSQVNAKGMQRYGFSNEHGAYSNYAKEYYQR